MIENVCGDWSNTITVSVKVFSGDGLGSEDSPYIIRTYEELKQIQDKLSAHYILGNDIDAQPSWGEGADDCVFYNGSLPAETNPCSGWMPIGNETEKFTGL